MTAFRAALIAGRDVAVDLSSADVLEATGSPTIPHVHRPQEVAAQEFADLLAQHAKRQFEEGRATLGQVKRALKRFAEQTVIGHVNSTLPNGQLSSAQAWFVRQWEWCVTLRRSDSEPTLLLEFGPTAVVENARVPVPLVDPGYTKVFVTRQAVAHEGVEGIVQTDVGLERRPSRTGW